MSLSHVLTRDQVIELGYFGSVTRANDRLLGLRQLGLIRVLDTPFFNQHLYAVCSKASEVVGGRLAPLTASRTGSPRFLQHALCVTNTRIALKKKGATVWRFEQQLTHRFRANGTDREIRPDGMAVDRSRLVVVEVDLGHVAPQKFREKLKSYEAFRSCGECQRVWNVPSFSLLVVTTGEKRAAHLARLLPNPGFPILVKPMSALGIPSVGAWS